jgi:hypothetical protein
MQAIRVICFVALLFVFGGTPATADVLQDQMTYWRSQAFTCSASGGLQFPSKVGTISPGNPQGCDDGDMTLFNSLLCIAGELVGCQAVKSSQDASGRWWRSPRRVGIEHTPNNGEDDSFSPDQALGVMLYVTAEKQSGAFANWAKWIEDNRPCWISAGGCKLAGWPRYCTDDTADKRCTLRPVDCALVEAVGVFLSAGTNSLVCKATLESVGYNKPFDWPLEPMALGSTILDDVGFPMHLAAVQILILQKLNLYPSSTAAGAKILALREPKNPFFQYLAQGNTSAVRDLTLALCPNQLQPRTDRSEWAWERGASEQAWKKSMYWDCIFMGKLLGAT